MFDLDGWQEIYATLRKNRLRTALSACGVFWGIFMLVMMLGFGNGLENGVTQSMSGFATNSVYMWARRTSLPYRGMQPGRRIEFTNEDMEALRREIPGIKYLAPRNRLGGWRGGSNVSRGGETGSFMVTGDYPDMANIERVRMVQGRFLNQLDIADSRKVAIIGTGVHEVLFPGGEDPIGESIQINGVYFTVVGLFAPVQTGDEGDRRSQSVFIPFTTFQQAFNTGPYVDFFAINARDDVSASKVEEQARALLAARHRVAPDDNQAIGSFNAEREFGKIRGLFIGIQIVVWFVGVMTLLAGVIGVSNIMLIVVKERTKELGIRKALGATPLSITSQIVQEFTALTAVAGYAGLVAGVALLELFGGLIGGDGGMIAAPEIDIRIALIALAILVVSGVFAGFLPARAAVRINPVEALRAE